MDAENEDEQLLLSEREKGLLLPPPLFPPSTPACQLQQFVVVDHSLPIS
jgi:hypothetical protein